MNIGNTGELTIRQQAELVLATVNPYLELIEKPLPLDDLLQSQLVIALAKDQYGLQPKVPLEQGLDAAIYYSRNLLEGSTPQ